MNMEITTSDITIVSQYYAHGLIHGRYYWQGLSLGNHMLLLPLGAKIGSTIPVTGVQI